MLSDTQIHEYAMKIYDHGNHEALDNSMATLRMLAENGMAKDAQALTQHFCRLAGLDTIDYQDFIKCIEKALNYKSLTEREEDSYEYRLAHWTDPWYYNSRGNG
jgi:hypothetical protein